jgi:hypothetical protein
MVVALGGQVFRFRSGPLFKFPMPYIYAFVPLLSSTTPTIMVAEQQFHIRHLSTQLKVFFLVHTD